MRRIGHAFLNRRFGRNDVLTALKTTAETREYTARRANQLTLSGLIRSTRQRRRQPEKGYEPEDDTWEAASSARMRAPKLRPELLSFLARARDTHSNRLCTSRTQRVKQKIPAPVWARILEDLNNVLGTAEAELLGVTKENLQDKKFQQQMRDGLKAFLDDDSAVVPAAKRVKPSPEPTLSKQELRVKNANSITKLATSLHDYTTHQMQYYVSVEKADERREQDWIVRQQEEEGRQADKRAITQLELRLKLKEEVTSSINLKVKNELGLMTEVEFTEEAGMLLASLK